jgi:phosphonate transport system substrate-binding protein
MRSDLAPSLKEKIRNTFWNLSDPEVLAGFKGATEFGQMSDEDYDVVRELASVLNLDLDRM